VRTSGAVRLWRDGILGSPLWRYRFRACLLAATAWLFAASCLAMPAMVVVPSAVGSFGLTQDARALRGAPGAYKMAGGGYETQFPYEIPPEYLAVRRP
jgi:hypothetical protein